MTRKRRLSDSDQRSDNPPKRREVIVIDDDEEQSMEDILLLIKQQEESEALARQLQSQYDNVASTSQSTCQHEVISELHNEADDEAMARRLEREWAEQDGAIAPPAQIQSQSIPSTSAVPPVENGFAAMPHQRLKDHINLFIASRSCTKCGGDVTSPRGFVMYSSQIPPPSLLALLHATCPSCKTNHCRGCFKVLPCSESCKGKSNDRECPVLSCCAEVRAIALFEALGGFDRQYLGERATSESRSREAVTAYRANKGDSVGPGGTGYGTGSAHTFLASLPPVGRGSHRHSMQQVPMTPPSSAHANLAGHWDEIVVRAMDTITMLLPAPYAECPQVYDMLPHPAIIALLQLSQLPQLLSSLLRNDSVTDWILRDNVYQAMFALLRRMADCELTLDVLIGERYEIQKSGGLEEYVWGDADITWEMANGKPVKANPLYVHFQKLTKQSETFLAGASRMLEDSQDMAHDQDVGEDVEATIKGASLCGEIIAARDDLERAMKVLGKDPNSLCDTSSEIFDAPMPQRGKGRRKDKGKGPDPFLALERNYREVCEKLAFQHVVFPQEGRHYKTFNYNNDLQRTASSTRNPKDRLHLIKELAIMATSLPTGVWVRVDEVRTDALKIMIAGPEGTPYEGGLFEFDCFLPMTYPHTPPQMHLRTTGGGTVRFNPNLYNCGKVCLSLLGTWPGRPEEQWSPKSTLLQVLVSIQSMILVELPYFNEPGYGKASAKNCQSIEYNKRVAGDTVRWAIVEWLKDEHQGGIWADVISSHFTIRAPKIRNCIEQWAKTNPRIRNYSQSQAYIPAVPCPAFRLQPTAQGTMEPAPQIASTDLLRAFDSGMETIERWLQAWKT